MTELEITVATGAERGVLEALFQLSIHDFSEHWADEARGEIDEDGRFEPYDLDPYWRDAGAIPLLLRRKGRLAGFALVNATGHSGQPTERNMAEFFVARKHRRSGFAQAAALEIFSRYPGQWEAAVARRNVVALAFWRRTVAAHPQARDIEELALKPPAWDGAVLRFRIDS
ncbi:GNAT family N-acetyltransferase [Phenylobacterium sp.]|uniref:GNAT family N-acetyltransferase n=1 Tax=Phenylobacterium sp. TaxID=1871053 RepID=UPI00286CF675|nr:GNAT family N-acetyltransferase [Phenylobacterium sp.]